MCVRLVTKMIKKECSYQIGEGHIGLGGKISDCVDNKITQCTLVCGDKKSKRATWRTRRLAERRGLSTLGVTWWATFRRRTDLERRSPRARVRGECTLPHPAPATRRPPAVALGPQHCTPLLHLHSPLMHHPPPPPASFTAGRHHTPLPTRLPHTSTDDTTRHTFPIKYHRQVYWHRVSRTIAQICFLIRNDTYEILISILVHFVCKTERPFTQKILIHKQNIEHNLWSWAVSPCPLTSAKQSGIHSSEPATDEWTWQDISRGAFACPYGLQNKI